MPVNFILPEAHFNRLFPFYILINQEMVIESNGTTLQKFFKDLAGETFGSNFKVKNQPAGKPGFESLKALSGQLLVIECNNEKQTKLRGQVDYLPETNQLLFTGSPRFNSIEEVKGNNLSVNDFAHHDSTTDLLRGIKLQEITNDDLKYLLRTVERQKNELKEANTAINDIALFSTQNPDPLIRINFAGDVIQNNPTAAQLDFLEFEGTHYRNDDFFKLVATNIDTTKPRCA